MESLSNRRSKENARILLANSRERPVSRSLARMEILGNENPASPTARTNSPTVSARFLYRLCALMR